MARRIVLTMLALVSILAGGSRPAAADWSVGSNLGVTIWMPSGGGDNTVFVNVPAGSQLLVIGTMPGLRLGIADAERREEFHLDAGLAVVGGGGETYTTLQLQGDYQHSFGSKETGQPYLTAGIGIDELSGGGDSFNRWRFGFGVGHRQFVAGGHGSVRGELRYDRVPEKSEGGFTTLPALNVFEMRIGFDLWPQ